MLPMAGRIVELGFKLEQVSEVKIELSEDVNSSVENDNGRRAVPSADADGPTPGSPFFTNELKSKALKIREALEQVTSEDSRKRISRLLTEVQQLPDVEKLLLYLRLPSGSKVEVDPLKQSFVSSLGNRYEVTQTVTWIQTHLEEDTEVSLPKQEVYDGYCEFCKRVSMKPLSTADFGKVMKQVFPNVRPRRLGTRGNSRYCYAGLRKKLMLETPRLPDLNLTHEEPLEDTDGEDQELNGAISFLIREWAEKVLEHKFGTLKELACHVVEKGYVTGSSVATFAVVSCAANGQNGKSGQQPYSILNQCDGSKHQEARIQLQRKLHERESIKEQKKRLVEQKIQSDRATSHSAIGFTPTSSSLSKLGNRKNPSSKSAPPDTLRKLLANPGEYGTPGNSELKKHLSDVACCSSCDNTVEGVVTPKLEKNGNLETTSKMSPLQKRRASGQCAGTSSAELAPLRRRSGGGESKSPKPSGWGTPVSDIMRNTKTPLSSENVATCQKPGKILISRVATRSNSNGVNCGVGNSNGSHSNNNNGSKLCFPPTNIIIFPQISTGVPISTEINGGNGGSAATTTANNNGANGAGGGQKSKYKLIQPKPCTLSSSNEVKSTSESAAEKDNERKVSRRVSSSSAKRNADDKDDAESVKSSKNRKRNKHPSECEKTKSKKLCVQQQRIPVEEIKCPPKGGAVGEEGINEGPESEMNIATLEQDALMDFFNDSTPSAEQEDELVRYFGNGDDNIGTEMKDEMCQGDNVSQSEEISRLRQLLAHNLKPPSKLPSSSEHQTNQEGSELTVRRESGVLGLMGSSAWDVNVKDIRSPTIRALLRSGNFSDGQQLVTESDQSNNVNNLNVASGGSSAASIASVNVCQQLQESWRQGNNGGDYMSSATRNFDEILMSSDSSSGCYPSISASSYVSLEEGFLERSHENPVNHQQQFMESGHQFNSGITYTGHVVSYPQQGNGNSSVPPSPNTRRRAFNFQPISPQSTPVQETHSCTQSPLPYGPMLSTVRTSSFGPPSATSSPFVSPRSTPSSMCRSRHNSGQAMNTAPSSALGTPRATPHQHHLSGEQQSSLQVSPFISPHPTPVPFARSRHNSSQQQQQQQRFANNNNLNLTPCTSTPGRSRNPSELMLGPLHSPGGVSSAPMSPLEVQQQSHSSITHYCDTDNPFNNNRSRHNSNSNYVSLPPPLPLHSSSNPLALCPPPPPPLKLNSDLAESGLLIHNWQMNENQTNDWPNSKQMDPRLLSRHRHSSVDSHYGQPSADVICSPTPPTIQSGLNANNVELAAPQFKKVETNELQGVVNRSRSVPICQLMQNMIPQVEPSSSDEQPIRDVMMSHSYPATPTCQTTTFNFGNELRYSSLDEGDEVELVSQPLNDHPYEGGDEVSANEGNNLSETLALPMDQYQNIIPPCHLDDFMLHEFGLETSCFAETTATSTHH